MLLRTKITGFCLIISILPLLFMGVYSVQTASDSLEKAAFEQLAAVRDVQSSALQDLFETWHNETVMFSRVKEVYNAVGMFRDHLYGLTEEGKPTDLDEEYMGIYDFVAPAFAPFVKDLGFEDALLLDDYGRVVFSVNKGKELGEDLAFGKYKDTGLARAWKEAVKGNVTVVDVAPYAPLGGVPAAFYAAPVRSYTGDIMAVAALRLPLSKISSIVSEVSGMGTTGDAYLVGGDGIMRSDSRNGMSMAESFAVGSRGKHPSEAVAQALTGANGVMEKMGHDGSNFLAAYTPLELGEVRWALVTEISEEEAFAPVHQLRLAVLILGGCTALFVAGITFLFLRRAVAQPFARILRYVHGVSGGDLHVQPEGSFRGEIGEVVEGLQNMVTQLKEKLGFAEGILSGMTVPCVVTDNENTVQFVNSYFLDMMEYPGKAEVYIGRPASELLQHKEGEQGSTSRCIGEQCAIFDVERDWTSFDGNARRVRIDCAPLYDLDSHLIGAIALMADLTDIRAKEAHISSQNDRMTEVAQQADQIAGSVSDEAGELARQVEVAGEGARHQVAKLEETAGVVDDMNRELREAARFAQDTVSDAESATGKAESGQNIMQQTTHAMESVRELSERLKESMQDLGGQADSIGDVLELISDIADQTNLLALNAAIEAARAGDAGRGFAVVADEVRKLAERTMEATNQVNKSVRSIQQGAQDNIARTDEAVQAVHKGNRLVSESSEALQEIVALSIGMGKRIHEIAEVSNRHAEHHSVLIEAFQDIRGIATETESGMERSEVHVGGLAENVRELSGLIQDLRR